MPLHPDAEMMVREVIDEGGANPTLFRNCVLLALEIWEFSDLPHAPLVVAALRRCTDVEAARAILTDPASK
jgi:hypothetical protein